MDLNNLDIRTFVLIFTSIIWRRIWVSTYVYSKHNKIKISTNVLLKSLKFNIFSDAGIVHQLKYYIDIALKDGFILPNISRNNKYATIAVNIFKKAYKSIKKGKEDSFIQKYGLSILGTNKKENDKEDNNNTNEKELLEEINLSLFDETCMNGTCRMCQLINSWDINEAILFLGDVSEFQIIVWNKLIHIMPSF